jgi:hypothetical protein
MLMPKPDTNAAPRWRSSRRLGKPESPGCVTVLAPNGALTAEEIFALMIEAEDWRPVSDLRTPMAFALARDWVFKSDLSRRRLACDRVALDVLHNVEVAAKVGIWHPAKTWFLVRVRRRYLVCSATPRLHILPRVGLRRLLGVAQRRRLIAKAAACGLRLDNRRSNFGYSLDSWRLYYLDDEVYPLRR